MTLRTSKTSKVSFHVLLRARENPTAGTIEFGVGISRTEAPSNFSAGTWGAYEPLTGKVNADTPTMGSGTAGVDLTSFEPGRLVLWYRLTVGAEVDELPWQDGTITLIA